MMEVTITVLSMHGIIAKKKKTNKQYITKNKNNTRNDRHRQPKKVGNETTSKEELSVVASFHTSNDDDCKCQTHVPSLKVPLHSPPSHNNNSSSLLDLNVISQPVIHWPADTRGGRGGSSSQALSTLKFIGEFIPEDDQIVNTEEDDNGEEVPRYQPKTCSISLSIFRNGKMVEIGTAKLVINGEENGENSINVPICNTIKHKTLKKVANSSKRKHPNMTRIKDDTFQFGIKENAMIRVLVHVSKIPQDQQETLKLISSTNRDTLRLSTAKYESSSSTLITAETSYSSVSSSEHQDKVPKAIQVTRPPPQEEEESKASVVCGMPYVYFSFRPREDKQEYEEGFYTGELDSNSGVPHGMGTWRSEDGMSLMEGEWCDGHLLRKNNSDGTLDRSWSDIIDPQDQALPKYLEPIQEMEHSMRSSVSGEEEEEDDDDIIDSRHKKKVNRRHSCPEPPRLKMNSFVEEVGHKEEKKRTKKKKGRKPRQRRKSISSCEEDETTSPDNLCQPCR